jgi:hypothetical protein
VAHLHRPLLQAARKLLAADPGPARATSYRRRPPDAVGDAPAARGGQGASCSSSSSHLRTARRQQPPASHRPSRAHQAGSARPDAPTPGRRPAPPEQRLHTARPSPTSAIAYADLTLTAPYSTCGEHAFRTHYQTATLASNSKGTTGSLAPQDNKQLALGPSPARHPSQIGKTPPGR